jgi:biopolymer transport protein ExbB/TolQ
MELITGITITIIAFILFGTAIYYAIKAENIASDAERERLNWKVEKNKYLAEKNKYLAEIKLLSSYDGPKWEREYANLAKETSTKIKKLESQLENVQLENSKLMEQETEK